MTNVTETQLLNALDAADKSEKYNTNGDLVVAVCNDLFGPFADSNTSGEPSPLGDSHQTEFKFPPLT